MNIGTAIGLLREGKRATREAWCETTASGGYSPTRRIGLRVATDDPISSLPYVFFVTATGDCVPWVCTQEDLLAQDWVEYV